MLDIRKYDPYIETMTALENFNFEIKKDLDILNKNLFSVSIENENSVGFFSKIFEFIKTIFTKISNFFKSLFGIKISDLKKKQKSDIDEMRNREEKEKEKTVDISRFGLYGNEYNIHNKILDIDMKYYLDTLNSCPTIDLFDILIERTRILNNRNVEKVAEQLNVSIKHLRWDNNQVHMLDTIFKDHDEYKVLETPAFSNKYFYYAVPKDKDLKFTKSSLMDFNFFMKTIDNLKIIETVDIEDYDYSKILFLCAEINSSLSKIENKVNSEMSKLKQTIDNVSKINFVESDKQNVKEIMHVLTAILNFFPNYTAERVRLANRTFECFKYLHAQKSK